ncbi:MAG: Gfo/Idh/MocA family oxidoreductase [Planctomycetota bacterium]|jgi:predicted dehydrogenase|nr:Gfo/Idh/MocA family oxidoreductase [Planctomycetota bacterium]MDP7131560.1 Gfo/Idh/MocA family oxidoreductase [Planctomycetota bacterium]MDP7250552.1 Gfo/Idh/MocA family oxidoreductase [Planctomycetota bacterium]
MSIRYGMIGTGMVAGWLVRGFQGCERSELAAVASRSEEKAQAFAQQHEISSAHGSYDELLADDSIQAVVITTPNTLHREWTEKAAQAGKHVLCEKPAAMGSDDTQAMIAACDSNSVHFMEAAMYRFQPQIARVLELIQSGRIGQTRLIQGAFCFPFKQEGNIRLQKNMGGGCLFDLGFYPISFAVLAAGQSPSNVFGASFYGETEVDLSTSAALQFENGVSAVAECAFRTDVKIHAEITGEEGGIRMPDPWTARGTKKEVEILKNRKLVETVELEDPNAYTTEIDHFSDVIAGEAEQLWTAEDTLRTISTLEAISKSARIGEAMNVDGIQPVGPDESGPDE